MPFIELTMPVTDEARRRELAERLDAEFKEATGFEDETLHICFREYEPARAAVAGKLCDSGNQKLFCNLILYTPRLRHDIKRAVGSSLSKVLTGDWTVAIHILEFPYDNIAMNGQLLSDADEELASRPFYYVLPH